MLSYSIEEALVAAIMQEIPLVIVEGKDDVSIYKKLIEKIDKKIDVWPIGLIDGFSSGSKDVIKAIEEIQPKLNERSENLKYILGIIDKDIRDFRNEIPDINGLFVLKYYSIESHFATQLHVKKVISLMTDGNIDDSVLFYVENLLEYDYEELYYISLECLKNACVSGYQSITGYDEKNKKDTSDKNRRKLILNDILERQEQLDKFAEDMKITRQKLKEIVKGKWLLSAFCNSMREIVFKLKNACKTDLITKCIYCYNNNRNNCQWKIKVNFEGSQIEQVVLNDLDLDELDYIIKELELLGFYDERKTNIEHIMGS